MNQEYIFDSEHEFVAKVKELLDSGVPKKEIHVFTPVHVHEADEMLREKPTFVRVFAVVGAIAGCISGLALTEYSVWRYPVLVTGGKPLFAVLPYMVIMFELTILFGSLATFAGFLLLARLPYLPRIIDPLEYGNNFAIVVGRDPRPGMGHPSEASVLH